MNRAINLLCLLAAVAVGIAGCGDGSSETTDGVSTPVTAPATEAEQVEDPGPKKGAWGVVFGAEGEDLGIILYDLSGHTLYAFSKDRGTTSVCYGACAKAWPPALTEGRARADGEAIPSKVGTTKRKDGTVQLTYAGHPLYTHARERQAETKGHGAHAFGGEWYALRPSGEKP